MTALYLLAQEYRDTALALADLDLDAQTVADTLESIGGELEHKAQNIAYVIRSIDADGEACRAWAAQAEGRSKALHARANSLRAYLASAMQACAITKISGPGVALSFRASHAVVVDEPALIPQAYMRQAEVPPPAPDKTALMAAMKLGELIPGAHIETRQTLQIK